MSDQVEVVEKWAYAGYRLDQNNKFLEEWFPESGDAAESLWYAKRRDRFIIGGIYDVRVVRTSERTSRIGEPVWTGDHVENAKRREWAAAESAARTRREIKLRESNAAKLDALDEALAPLLELAGKCRTRAQLDALTATVLRRMLDRR